MFGKIIGATVGRKAARSLGTKIGGPAGAAIGYGLASRRFRKLALGGLAVMGGLAAFRAMKNGEDLRSLIGSDDEPDAGMPETNKDPLPAYAPHS